MRAAVRERNLVPRSEEAFLGGGVAAAVAWGMVAATLGSLASSAALEGVRLVVGAGSAAAGAGVAGDGVGARGSFCDFGAAGEEGDRVAHAGSTAAVSLLEARAGSDEGLEDADEEPKERDAASLDDEAEGLDVGAGCARDENVDVEGTADVDSHLGTAAVAVDGMTCRDEDGCLRCSAVALLLLRVV